jgi:[ribosomal protein S5]-alanine N-acetyltransferase
LISDEFQLESTGRISAGCSSDFTTVIALRTKRLALRHLVEDDLDNLQKIFSDPKAMRFYPATKSRPETAAWIQRLGINSYEEFGYGLFAVIRREDDVFLGECGFIHQVIEGEPCTEIGYHMIREYWGRGYATEAATACLQYGFETLDLTTLVSVINPENTASIRVAEKSGMGLYQSIPDFKGCGPDRVYRVQRSDRP